MTPDTKNPPPPGRGPYTVTLDDDPMVARIIEKILGMRTIPFETGEALLSDADAYRPVAAFVDIHLGSASGLELIPKLRERWPFCPILVITSDPADEAVADALKSGADDFVRKPVRPNELLSRFQVRVGDMAEREARVTFRAGGVSLNTVHRVLRGGGKTVYLTPLTTNLLACLMQAKGTPVSRTALKRRTWGDIAVSDNALDRKIYELREALAGVGGSVRIRNIYGTGFVLDTGAPEGPDGGGNDGNATE